MGGICYDEGDTSVEDSRLQCVSAEDNLGWTLVGSKSSDYAQVIMLKRFCSSFYAHVIMLK